MSLSSIYADYVSKEEKKRDPMRLFISDVGKCPRQIAYRMLETPKNFVGEQAAINKLIMFDLAEYIESSLWEALGDDGIDYQFEVNMPDRENWGGRGDIIADYDGRRIIEVKTVHPGAFKHTLDYPTHKHQATIYHHYCEKDYELDALPLLVYFDRGGQNTPVEQVVDENWLDSKYYMDGLEIVREKLPDLPPKLPKVLKERNWKKDIVQEADYRCNYCDYSDACEPDMSKSVWAHRDDSKKPYTPRNSAETVKLLSFIDSLIRHDMDMEDM